MLGKGQGTIITNRFLIAIQCKINFDLKRNPSISLRAEMLMASRENIENMAIVIGALK